jgi:hypothetical protein
LESESRTPPSVVAVGEFARFESILARVGLSREARVPEAAYALVETDSGLELRPPGEHERAGVRATFPPDRHDSASPRKSPLARAFGRKIHSVFDLTAGLGADAYRLAMAGYRVRARERHPVIYALAASAWQASCEAGRVPVEISERLEIEWGEGSGEVPGFEGGDVGAYLDPMYPVTGRQRALPKRALQVLRDLLEGDDEPVELLGTARERLSRVVVKRPHHAPPLAPGVSYDLETKLVRFDVYLNPARMEAPTS